jgi:Relaxase/Mobilisation nuclease domain.
MIAKMIKGKGFRGALEYDLRQEKGQLLDTNMAGSAPRTLAREFGEVRALRPNLTRAVCHVSLSIAPGERLTDDQWRDVAQKYLEHMGFSDSQYVVTKHTDTEHPHIHILANRVTMKGEVVSDSHDYKRQETLMRRLEQEYSLSQVVPSKEAARKTLSKGEIEHVLRTGEASVRTRLQEFVDNAIKENSELRAFINRLAQDGVETKLNQASTGRISGISFSLDGVALKGSDLGKAYTWNSLQKRGLQHEQDGYGTRHEHGLGQGAGEGTPDSRQGAERGGNIGNAPELAATARHAEIEKQRRIDEGFERLARAYQGRDLEREAVRERSKSIPR